jgi:uncharacterized hydrophobic protein (TIGR00271 family)
MTDTQPGESSRPVRDAVAAVRREVNPATAQGVVALLGGLVILGLPGVSAVVLETILGAALLVVGLLTLGYALTGRGWSVARSRPRSAIGGGFAVAVGACALYTPTLTTDLIIMIAGSYLGVRGTALLVFAALRPGTTHRRTRVTVGLGYVALAFGSLTVPEAIGDSVVVTGGVLAVLAGLVLISYGTRAALPSSGVELSHTAATRILWDWVRDADLGRTRRSELTDMLYFEPPTRRTDLTAWWVMLVLSVTIATFAVLQDSTAVVIGAMLIAPLMQPILGLSGALVNGWPRRAASSLWLVAAGSVAAIALSALLSRWVPGAFDLAANPQIAGRTAPTLLDLLIALAAGSAGAFATVHARVAASLPGVAIAVALVPPLSVVGVTLSHGDVRLALGALLLFVTNFVAIVLSAALVFVLGGFADPEIRDRPRKLLLTLTPFAAAAVVILVPLVYTGNGVVAQETRHETASQTVEDWLEPTDGIRVLDLEVDDGSVRVELAGSPPLPDQAALQRQLAASLDSSVELTIEFIPSRVTTIGPDGTER